MGAGFRKRHNLYLKIGGKVFLIVELREGLMP